MTLKLLEIWVNCSVCEGIKDTDNQQRCFFGDFQSEDAKTNVQKATFLQLLQRVVLKFPQK